MFIVPHTSRINTHTFLSHINTYIKMMLRILLRNKSVSKVVFIFICLFLILAFYRLSLTNHLKDTDISTDTSDNNDFSIRITDPPKAIINTKYSSVEQEEQEEEWQLDHENIPELSMILPSNKKNKPKEYSKNCAKFPDLYNVRFSNVHWQIQSTEKEMYYFYSAYLDIRSPSTHPHHPYDNAYVRVLAMSDLVRMNEKNSTLKVCQFWFENKPKPVFGNITEVRMVWNYLWGNRARYFPYLISCKMPAGLRDLPVSVSVVPKTCTNASNNLNILHRDHANSSSPSPKKDFGVCVKALDFPEETMRDRLVEWIETLRLLGADKIFFYEYFVDYEIKRVLEYYESRGIIGVTPITLPGELPNQPQLRHLYIQGKRLDKRLTELIPYNDCFYKNMYDFKYVAVMDTDEIIIPQDNIKWPELIKIVDDEDIGYKLWKKKPISTYCFENYYYLDGMLDDHLDTEEISSIPENFHMLRHIYRSSNSTGKRYMKCFHSTEATLGVHNHFAFFCREGKQCNRHYINVNRAQMNHYRETCVKDIKNCTTFMLETTRDTKLWRFKDELVSRVEMVLNYLNSKNLIRGDK